MSRCECTCVYTYIPVPNFSGCKSTPQQHLQVETKTRQPQPRKTNQTLGLGSQGFIKDVFEVVGAHLLHELISIDGLQRLRVEELP